MKYVKKFESFQINEELSLRGVYPIISSLFLTFNSFDASAFGHSYGISPTSIAIVSNNDEDEDKDKINYEDTKSKSNEIRFITNKIERDLKKLNSETTDYKLSNLIKIVQSLDRWEYKSGLKRVKDVANKIDEYIKSEKLDASLIGDSLNNITSGDIKLIEADYKKLLNKYNEIEGEQKRLKLDIKQTNDPHTGDNGILKLIVILCAMSLVFFTLIYSIHLGEK